jgi:hypothetical protein
MSEVKTAKLSPRTGAGTVTLGTSGDTFDIPSGVTLDVTGATVTGLSAGKVLQVVSSMMAGASTTSSTALVTTGLEGTITPSATSSKILISISFALAAAGGDAAPWIQLFKGSSVISGSLGDVQSSRRQSSVGMAYNAAQSTAFNYLDSPSTTSATTYKLMYACGNSGQDLYMNLMSTGDSAAYYTSPATMILMEIEG